MNEITFLSPVSLELLSKDVPDGVELRDTGIARVQFSADSMSIPLLAIKWGANIATSVIANFIYDAIKKHSKKPPQVIHIEEVSVKFEKGAITEFIQKKITVERDE